MPTDSPLTAPAYERRHLSSRPVLTLGTRRLKRYLITRDGGDADPQVLAAADAFAEQLLPTQDDDTPPAGFVVLHLVDGGAWLNAYTWVWDNVVHARFAQAPPQTPTAFAELTVPWIGCVWELAPLAYERQSWVRHLRRPAVGDLEAYLADPMPSGWFD